MKKAKFIRSGKVIKGRSVDLWVRLGIAEYEEEEVVHDDDDLEDQVFSPVDEKIKPKPKVAKPKKRRKKRTVKK